MTVVYGTKSLTDFVSPVLPFFPNSFLKFRENKQDLRERRERSWRLKTHKKRGPRAVSSAVGTILSSLGGVFGNQQVEEEEVDLGMDSKAFVFGQPRVGGVKQKNTTQGDGGNRNVNGDRRVLRDIGNLVIIEGGKQKNKCKKDALRVTFPEEEEAAISSRVKNEVEKPVKKRRRSLTAILTARSRAAALHAHEDIDAADVHDELAAVEYVEDIYNFYEQTEEHGRVDDYMGSQQEINSNMRDILVDWLIEVHNTFDLMPETLFLTINTVDRFLSLKTVSKTDLQLVGLTSMLIASKYEEVWAPQVSELIKISDEGGAYRREHMLLMEKVILRKLEWYLTVPTPYVFLVRYIKAAASDAYMENMAFFYAELGLISYSAVVRYSPSELAASAVYAAHCTLSRAPFWTPTLQHYTAYSEDHLLECAKALVGLHIGATENKLYSVYRKYSSEDRRAVALFPPAQF